MAISPLKVLTDYFNIGAGKRPMKDWATEVKALTPDEKTELATLAAASMCAGGEVQYCE